MSSATNQSPPNLVRLSLLTLLALLAFAGNSILCRMALEGSTIDPATFTSVRLISGAITLWFIILLKQGNVRQYGSWLSAIALFVYAAAFSFSYIALSAAMGALILFGAVQATMISYGLFHGERFKSIQLIGFALACFGLIGLLLPGLSAPPLSGAAFMLLAGIAWGVYSLRGKNATDPLKETAGNFMKAAPIAVVLSLILIDQTSITNEGLWLAIVSGSVTSGVGYAIWYAVLPNLRASHAATLQLSVPVFTAVAGVLILQEQVTLRFVLASLAILGGIYLVVKTNGSKS